MSNYTKSTNFATKDNLTPGDPLKVVRGTEIDTEYNNIATAVATKTDNASAAITGGTIDGATVGATTPATGSFTTLAASGTTTLAGALVGAATQAAFNTVSTTLNLGGAATAVNLGAATGTATVNNTTLAAKAITASTTLAVTGTSTLTGAVTATAGVTGPITSSSVSITGGSITGITDLAVADGGTGASTAAGALNNLLPSQTSNANKYLQTDGTNASWDAVSLSTADITGTLPVANGGTGVTSSTGTGNVVLSNSPTLVTPALGTPSSAVLTNATGLPISTGVSGLGTGVATLLATPSSANLASAITDETGSGSLVFATSPTLVTPILGTPTSGTLTNATGLPISTGVSGLGTGVATFLATPSSANLAAALTDETGSGANVFATSPTLVTPILGTPTSATLTNATGLPLTTGVTGTLPTANGGTNLTSFTSGGVVYASSSSALATGSTLIYDGSNFGVGASPDSKFYVGGGALGTMRFFYNGTSVNYNDVDLQIWRTAGASELARLTSTGLGIGTSSPGTRLEISSGGGSSPNLSGTSGNFAITQPGLLTSLQMGGYASAPYALWIQAQNKTGGSFPLAINPLGGDVGIGTSSPNSYTGYTTLTLNNATTGGVVDLNVNGTRTGSFLTDSVKTTIGSITNIPLAFNTNATEKMRLDSSGNLGLGVTPSAWSYTALQVGSSQGIAISSYGSGGGMSCNAYDSATGWRYVATATATLYQQNGGSHKWNTAASGTAGNPISFTQAMTLDASGNLIVADTTAAYSSSGRGNITIGGSSTSLLGFRVGGVNKGYLLHSGTNLDISNTATGYLAFSTDASERARITSGGYFKASNVGTYIDSAGSYHELRSNANTPTVAITNTNGSLTDDVIYVNTSIAAGTGFNLMRCYSNGVAQFRIRGDGTLYAQNTTIQSISDARLKENIVDAVDGLSVITALRPVRFDFKQGYGNNRKNVLGFIAQEIEQVFPDAVDESDQTSSDGDFYKTVGAGALIPVLVKAIQELKAEFDAYKASHP